MPNQPNLRDVLRHPIQFIAVGFGSGLLPKMPGTYGTVVAIPLYIVMSSLSLITYTLITLALILFAIYACHVTARSFAAHDHPSIVIDEIVGYLVTMIAVPCTWLWILVGFLLFRLFDIWKPWPIRWLDHHVQGGLGIVVDDLLAGVYAAILLLLLIYVCSNYHLLG